MIYYVYILKSRKNGKRYTGFTRKPPAVRLAEHNKGINRWTSKNRPFDLVYFESFRSRKDCLNRENILKRPPEDGGWMKRLLFNMLFPCSSAGRACGCSRS